MTSDKKFPRTIPVGMGVIALARNQEEQDSILSNTRRDTVVAVLFFAVSALAYWVTT